MLVKNAEKWGDKVQIVGLGMDDELETLKNRVTEKNWNNVTHYKLNGGFSHPVSKSDFGIKGIPFVALYNKEGVLVYKGHPSNTDLEKWITCLVEDKEFVQRKKKEIGDSYDTIEDTTDL